MKNSSICLNKPPLALIFCFITFFMVDANAANITYIGDSQSAVSYGLFGNLTPQIESRHKIAESRAVCGATIDDYAIRTRTGRCTYSDVTHLAKNSFESGSGTTSLVTDLTNSKTDVVIVQLGDNHLGESEKLVTKKVKHLVTQILNSNKSCIWIGPMGAPGNKCSTENKQKKEVSRIIQKTLSNFTVQQKRCKFIDSYKLSKDKIQKGSVGPYCLHYTELGYKVWSKSISGRILTELNNINKLNRSFRFKSKRKTNPLQ